MKEIMEKIGQISFESFEEIYNMRDKAREFYKNFDDETKEIYKWYYYHQLCIMKCSKKEPLKDYLWSYIVEKDNIKAKLKKEYDKFYKKTQKIKEKEAKNPSEGENINLYELFGL